VRCRWHSIALAPILALTLASESRAQSVRYEGRVHFEHTSVSGGRADWVRYGLGATYRDRDAFRLDVYSGERFDQRYGQAIVGWTGARWNGWTPDLELAFADEDDVVAGFGGTFSLAREVARGVVLGGRIGYQRFASDRALTLGLTGEIYRGPNLYLLGFNVNDSDDTGAGVGGNLGYRYYFTDDDYVGGGIGFGESRELAEPGDIRRTPVFGGFIQGRKRLGDSWAATLTVGYEDYRDLYRTRTIALTVRREF